MQKKCINLGKKMLLISLMLTLILMTLVGCGSKASAPKKPAGFRASERFFACGDWTLYLYFNNTAVHFNTKEQITENGTWTSEDDKVVFSMPGSVLDGKKLTYDGTNLLLDDQVYKVFTVSGLFQSEQTGKTLDIGSIGTFSCYTDFENRGGKDVGIWYLEGGNIVFDSPIFGLEPVIGLREDDGWTIGGNHYAPLSGKISLDVPTGMVFGIYQGEEHLLILNELLGNLAQKNFETDEDLTAFLQPGETSGDLHFTANGAKVILRCVNNHPQAAPLSECALFSFYTEDTAGVFAPSHLGQRCGETTFDMLLQPGCTDYDAEGRSCIIYNSFDLTATRQNDEHMPESDIIIEFRFEDEILHSFRIALTEYT